MFDAVIKNASVADGSRGPSYVADVAVLGDRIAAIGQIDEAQGAVVFSANGRTLAPGFVDVHNHSDAWLLKDPAFAVKTSQGFTTEILMSDGISYAPVNEKTIEEWVYYLRPLNGLEPHEYRGWRSVGEYHRELDRATAQNTAAQVPYANIRAMVCGWSKARPTAVQMREIQRLVAEGMADGASALSTGLEYVSECFATTDELVEACAPLVEAKGFYVTHIRYPLGLNEGLAEAVEIAARARVPLHVSHLKASNPADAAALLKYINEVAVNEVEFTFDVYPYVSASTMLHYLLPYDVWEEGPRKVRSRMRASAVQEGFRKTLAETDLSTVEIAWVPEGPFKVWQGKRLLEFVTANGGDAARAATDLLDGTELAVLLVFHRGDGPVVHQFLQHPAYMMGTDGIYFPNAPVHPRMFGSPGRLLGQCVRDHKLFSLEEAVYKLSTHAARRFGLADRGVIKVGSFADLVLFDPATVGEVSGKTEGIDLVLVNGKVVWGDGAPASFAGGQWPGRYLRYQP